MNGVVQTPTCALRRCRTPAHDVPTIARANPHQRQRDRTAGNQQNAAPQPRHWNINRGCRQADTRPNPSTSPPSPCVSHPDGAERRAQHPKPGVPTRTRPTVTTCPTMATSPTNRWHRRPWKPTQQLRAVRQRRRIDTQTFDTRTINTTVRQRTQASHRALTRRANAKERAGTISNRKTGAKKRAPPGVPGGAHEAGGDLLSRGAVSSATRA